MRELYPWRALAALVLFVPMALWVGFCRDPLRTVPEAQLLVPTEEQVHQEAIAMLAAIERGDAQEIEAHLRLHDGAYKVLEGLHLHESELEALDRSISRAESDLASDLARDLTGQGLRVLRTEPWPGLGTWAWCGPAGGGPELGLVIAFAEGGPAVVSATWQEHQWAGVIEAEESMSRVNRREEREQGRSR